MALEDGRSLRQQNKNRPNYKETEEEEVKKGVKPKTMSQPNLSTTSKQRTGPPGKTPHPTAPKISTVPVPMAQAGNAKNFLKPSTAKVQRDGEVAGGSGVVSTRVKVITDANDPESPKTNIAKDLFVPPNWKEYKVFADKVIMSWMKKSKLSSISQDKRKAEKSRGFEEISTADEIFQQAELSSQEGDMLLIGLSEELVLRSDFDLDQFSYNARKSCERLINTNKVKRIILCTLMPDTTRLSNSFYMTAIKDVNNRLWNLRKINDDAIFIFDMWKHIMDKVSKNKMDRRNLPISKPSGVIEAKVKIITDTEAPYFDNELSSVIREIMDVPKAERKKRKKPNLDEATLIDQQIEVDRANNLDSSIHLLTDAEREEQFLQEIDEWTRADIETTAYETALENTIEFSLISEDISIAVSTSTEENPDLTAD